MTELATTEAKTLTPRQETFCTVYVLDGNAKSVATEAGYASKYAAQQAYKLLQQPRVARRIEQLSGRPPEL